MPSLDNKIATFSYLSRMPYISVQDLPRHEHECPICHESYHLPTSADQPIKLRCGHVIGIQCVARYAFSRTSDSACPFCHTLITIDTANEIYKGSENALMSILAVFHGRPISTETREILIKELEDKLNNRNLLLFAAFLESLDASMDARNAALGLRISAPTVDEQIQSQ